ncbi:MAG TPA: ribosome-binding factor A [Polyangia bacterium]|nr:ribosome-binding factor A [Polyangia bacterium]
MSNREQRSRERERDGFATRSVRLQELIREEVSFMFDNELGDGRLQGVRITFVDLTPDGSCARIWYRAPPSGPEVEAALTRVGPLLRNRLAESLGLKRTPEVRFRRDDATRLFDNDHSTER